MAQHTVALSMGRFATILVNIDAGITTFDGAGSLRGYVYNAGKKKAWINTLTTETAYPTDDREVEGIVGIVPGMAVPLPEGSRGFTFWVQSGYTNLYWLPGDKPPVFSMSMATGADGLFVEDVNTRKLLEELSEKLNSFIEAKTASVSEEQ